MLMVQSRVLATSLVVLSYFLVTVNSFVLTGRGKSSSFIAQRFDKQLPVGFLRSTVTDAATPQNASPSKRIGNVIFLLPSSGADKTLSKFGSCSPVGNPSLTEAAAHLANKAFWFSDGQIDLTSVIIDENDDKIKASLQEADVLIALGITSEDDCLFARDIFQQRRQTGAQDQNKCQFALDCQQDETITTPIVGPYDSSSPSPLTLLPWTNTAAGLRMQEQMLGLFDRWTTDDFCVAIMLFFNQFVEPVDWVKYSIDVTWEKGPITNAQEFYSMISNCGDCIGKCLADEQCKECIDALNAVDTRDQVASYRTIVSYESELLKEFSYCILQQNNIFNCNAQIPRMPKVQPMATWRGNPLTEADAKSIIVGHLDDEAAPEGCTKRDVSWIVAAGANVAYDQFPSQNQLFYESVKGRDMWYDPVFRVETIDGRNVWCKRHYKVKPAKVPGTFRLSVLDNGVTSNEFWTIVGVADDLSWIVFHYAGAAGAVGQQYIGGLLCTANGSLPSKEHNDDIYKVLDRAGIQPWELFIVDNDPESPGALDAGPAPLNFYRDEVLANKKKESS